MSPNMERSIRNNVKKLLEVNPKLRDNTIMLTFAYHVEFCGISPETPYEEVIRKKIFREIPSLDTISRASRLMQEEHKHLRGDNWLNRQNKLQKKELDSLGYDVTNFKYKSE